MSDRLIPTRAEHGPAIGGPIGQLGSSPNQASVRSEPLSLGGQHATLYSSEDAIAQGFVNALQLKVKSLYQRRWNLTREAEALHSQIERLEQLIRDLS